MLRDLIVVAVAAGAVISGCSSAPAANSAARLAILTPGASPVTTATAAAIAPVGTPTPAPTGGVVFRSVSDASPAPMAIDAGPPASRAPVPTIAPTPTPTLNRSTAFDGSFSIDLYRRGSFASQNTTYYCVPAAIEVMMNLIDGRPFETSSATQDDLYALVRDALIEPYWGRGGQPEGWSSVLNDEGDGRYVVAVRATRGQAIRLAAQQLRLTNRPVGLLVWRGNHAWVMSGFTSIGDPAKTNDFTVTGVFIEDVWYPRVSRTWGAGRAPDSLRSIATLADVFLPYDQHGEGGLDKDGKFVLVIPVARGD